MGGLVARQEQFQHFLDPHIAPIRRVSFSRAKYVPTIGENQYGLVGASDSASKLKEANLSAVAVKCASSPDDFPLIVLPTVSHQPSCLKSYAVCIK
jgi:hypothetical protein